MKQGNKIALYGALCALTLAPAFAQAPAVSQTKAPPKEGWKSFFGEVYTDPQGRQIRRGDACRPPYTDKPGIAKVDACGRWYCGRADIKDLIEVRPNFAKEENCKWTYKDRECKCVKQASR